MYGGGMYELFGLASAALNVLLVVLEYAFLIMGILAFVKYLRSR